ncbi:MAG TPA: tyrosine-type recombinase/integrase [Candidatus Paceibacterota bacterium]|nr:tyrosine-type recombinase/integrase [Candidatus Paceibacterota bacterium]
MKKTNETIIDLIDEFFEYLDIEKGLSHNSQITYSRFINKFTDWLKNNNLKNLKPHELTSDHLWKYRVYLSQSYNKNKKEPLKRTSVNYYLIALRSLLNYFADRDIQSLPAEKIKLLKEKKEKSIKFLNLEQIKKLLDTPDLSNEIGLRDKAILEVLFSTGLRVSELVSLNRDQIKIENLNEDLEINVIGKGGRIRPVYLSPRALNALKDYFDTRKDKNNALFINYKGQKPLNRLTPRSIENIVRKYVIKAGISIPASPHTIRHSFATDLLTQGVDLRLVQEFLGHKNIATTQIYTHITSKQLRDIHKKYHSGEKLT